MKKQRSVKNRPITRPITIVSLFVMGISSVGVYAQETIPTESTPTETTASEASASQPVQSSTVQDPSKVVPWLYENSDIPVDDSWTFGVLENGLRYAVKRNQVPHGQISIRVRVDAGSLHENDDELGYAHLVEHLAFRGSTFVEDGEAKKIWQRFGVEFGSDSNAQTTPTQTVYQLDIPNAVGETFPESVKILSGMIRAPRLSEEAVEAEKLIVQAEKRESDGAQRRVAMAIRKHFFQNQRLSQRETIGSVQSLQEANAKGLRAFHKRWYRPEKTLIVMAGDTSPAIMIEHIEKNFSDWKVEGKGGVQPEFGAPTAYDSGDIGKIAAVITEDDIPSGVTLFYARPWFQKADTIVYNEQLLINTIAQLILNRRLESVARYSPDFWAANVNRDDISRSADGTSVSIRPSTDDWESAVTAVRAIIQDAIETPPSQADIDREVKTYADAIKTYVDSYPFENSREHVDGIVKAVDIREATASPDTFLSVFNNMQDKFNQANILKATQDLFEAPVKRAVFMGDQNTNVDKQRLAAIINANVAANTKVRLADKSVSLDDLPKLGAAGQLIKSAPIDNFNTEIWQFSNGVRAVIQPNKGEVEQVRIIVRFGSGYQSVDPENGGLLWAGPLILGSNGVGDLRQEQLDQLAVDRRLSLNLGVASDAFEFSAATRPEDLEGQLHLIAAKLSHPAWDPAPVNRIKLVLKQNESSANLTAQSVLQRDLEYLLKSKDLRWKTAQGKELDAFNNDAFRKTWEPLLKEGPIEVIVFGDFEREKLIPILERTFGALEPRTPNAISKKAATIAFPKPNNESMKLFHKGPKDQAAAVIGWPTGGGTALVQQSRHLEILSSILRDRLFERFRSQEAASYSPNVFSDWPKGFESGGFVLGFSQVQPKNVDRFFVTAKEIAADLRATPVSADELQRAIEPIRQRIERAATGNTFWMRELKGVSYDINKLRQLSTIFNDYVKATPEDIHKLAQQYLVDEAIWTLKILPEK